MQFEHISFKTRCRNTRATFIKAVTRGKAQLGQFECDCQTYPTSIARPKNVRR